MKNRVSTILFDLGGVILNLDYNLTIEAFKKLGGTDFDRLYSQAKQDQTFDLFETGKISSAQFRDYVRSFLGDQFTDEQIDHAWNAMLLNLPVERIAMLKKLKAHYRICLFSNTNTIHLKKFRKIIGDAHGDTGLLESLFDKTYYSHKIGMRKPNQEAFQYILNDQGLTADEVLFIDDSIQHIEGANALGIRTKHIFEMDILTFCSGLL